jgi:transcriptional regulator of arginine metabolism
MTTKKNRHKAIREAIENNEIPHQDALRSILEDKGFRVTQATLSRDIKELKIVKAPVSLGGYAYRLPDSPADKEETPTGLQGFGSVTIEFSGNMAVIKTRPGYAMAIAGEIDRKAPSVIVGTVAGDDTILLILRGNVDRKQVLAALLRFIPEIKHT